MVCKPRSVSAGLREPVGCGRLPGHRSESPTGYSSAGCSPAEPASASPVASISPPPTLRCNPAFLRECSSRPSVRSC